ncbi:DUF1543 domain-containing protein [Chryseobacterium sp. ERMR1:04]|uniref:DUF1543 domain-containing protein n=1 Tax=Chryseobacterium sp. ERMR1:04 TaxID=1705393 RepID=UPI0006C8DD37|nr:DUF1543 domain-containing protein [Chryseobacterium sp. ERMR1:04]KPH14787.1 hypothetical protein AMQ68_04935 [Chryseobacterium sp. ERMR1:04]
MKLFYMMLGTLPKGRNIEQHDVFFGIGKTLKDLVPDIKEFWKEADRNIYIGCWQEVNFVAGYEVKIIENKILKSEEQLYFLNLGGYKNSFVEEFHEQHLIMVGKSFDEVAEKAKSIEFYKTMGFEGNAVYSDHKPYIDTGNLFKVNDILPTKIKEKYSIILKKTNAENQDNPCGSGYLNVDILANEIV